MSPGNGKIHNPIPLNVTPQANADMRAAGTDRPPHIRTVEPLLADIECDESRLQDPERWDGMS